MNPREKMSARIQQLDDENERDTRTIAEAESRIAARNVERQQIIQAAAVYDSFAASDRPSLVSMAQAMEVNDVLRRNAEALVTAFNDAVAATTKKPDNIPTMPEMITTALQDAGDRGLVGLEPKEIAVFIREKWWPDAPISSIGPTVWRMWKDGRLQKDGERYALPVALVTLQDLL